jgi:purine-binding chemotaxis protein CheW
MHGGNMADSDSQFQLVTFQLGEELYGVDIMDVKEIVKIQEVRPIPNAPYYVEGIFNLRREIIPIINLHKRFRLKKLSAIESDVSDFEGGFIILNIQGNKVGIIIDRIARVVTINTADIKAPPQMLSGIGTEYIRGVIRRENGYIIMLDINRLFDPNELRKIIDVK